MKKIDSNDGGHYCNYTEIQKIIVLKKITMDICISINQIPYR